MLWQASRITADYPFGVDGPVLQEELALFSYLEPGS
jgi:hypothetical protein